MRRLFIIILSALPLFASATNTLSLSSVSGHPGETLTVSVSLANDEAVTALQVAIPLGEHLQYVANSALLNSTRSNGHSMVASASDDTLRVAVFSLTQAALNGNEGELFTFQVKLGNEPATYPLKAETVMTGTNGQALESNTANGSLTLLSPKIEVVTKSLDYGHIPIRANYTQTLQVRNVGNEPLHISNILFSASEFSVSETEYTIAAGQTQNIVITFAPTIHGAISEQVRLRSDAINDPDVYGANVCQLIADPFSVNELRVQPASGISDDTVTVRVRMNNMESIVGAQVSFKMPKQLVFVPGSAVPLSHAEGCSVLSTMSNDTLTLLLYSPTNTPVADEDGDLLSFRVRLDGASGSYQLAPKKTMLINASHQNMVSAVYNAYVSIQSPTISGNSSLDFGHIRIDQSHTETYSIRNNGQVPLTIERVTFLSEGLRVLTPLPIEIARNTSQNIEVEITPAKEGAFATTMQVYSNDPTARMKSVSLTADVYEPNSLSFREETKGTEYHLYVDLDNYSEIAGVQFDVTGLTPWTSYALTSRANGHQIVVQPIDENTYRVILFAFSNNTLSGHEGAVVEWIWDAESANDINGQLIQMENVVLVHPSKGNRKAEAADPFTTSYTPSDPTSINNTPFPSGEGRGEASKILRDGQIFILRGEKVYTLTGAEV